MVDVDPAGGPMGWTDRVPEIVLTKKQTLTHYLSALRESVAENEKSRLQAASLNSFERTQ